MKKTIQLCLFIPIFTLLTGCWDRLEVNDIAMITATAFDQMKNGDIRVSVSLAIPRQLGNSSQGGGSGGGGEAENTSGWVVSEQGENIMVAFRKLQEKLPRELFFTHNRAIVIGEELARKDVLSVLDYYERFRQSQGRSYILFTKGNAADIISFRPKFERLVSEIIKEEVKLGVGVKVRLVDILNMAEAEGQEPYASKIEMTTSKIGTNRTPGLNNLIIDGVGVMKQNKLVGWLDDKEMRGLLWLRNETKKSVVTIDVPEEMGGGRMSAEVSRINTKLQPIVKGGRIEATLVIDAELAVYESTTQIKMLDPRNLPALEVLFRKEIDKRVRLLWNKAKEMNTDFIGLGQALYKQHPDMWKQVKEKYEDMFPDSKLDIQANIVIRRVGMTNDPVSSK